MTTTNTSPNGARAKILRALLADGMLTTSELAERTGLMPNQARDNAVQARQDGLLTSGRDDVTRLVAYKITAKGREYCGGSAHSTPKSTASESPVDDAAKDLDGRSPIHKERDSLIRERDKLLIERDEARKDADRLRESSEQMNRSIYHLQSEIDERDAAAKESDAAINERLSKYDAVVGERSKLAVDVANLQADNDKLRRTILALESRAPSPMVTEYGVRHENGYIQSAGETTAEAVRHATEEAKESCRPVRVYGLVLIGTVEIQPVFVASES